MKNHQNQKLLQLINFDKEFKKKDQYIIGIDEAGRGPLCGPVVAAAIILTDLSTETLEKIKYLNDSKKFSGQETRREELYEQLIKTNCIFGIAEGSLEEIEEHNIYQTTYITMYKAYQQVIEKLGKQKHIVMVDGTKTIKYIDENIEQQAIVKGDGKSASIAAASILAKVYRDKVMKQLAEEFPQYKWDKNKGYPTKEHVEAIREYGRCKYHRMSYKIKGLDIPLEDKDKTKAKSKPKAKIK